MKLLWRAGVALLLGGGWPHPGTAAEPGEGVLPLQLALVAPVQLVKETYSVRGLRLNLLYGSNEDVEGFDLGLVNHTRGRFYGLAAGLVNASGGDTGGLRVALVNYVRGEAEALEFGLWNEAGSVRGGQFGLVNRAGTLHGLQVGLLNFARKLDGAQVGVLNFGPGAGPLHVMPLLNMSPR